MSSRPSSYHESPVYVTSADQDDPFDSNGFSLPLFNSHSHHTHSQSQSTNYPRQSGDSQPHLPPPHGNGGLGLNQRHSLHHPPPLTSPFRDGPHSPAQASAGVLPSPSQRLSNVNVTMASAQPYTSLPYNHPSNQEELLLPPTSTSLGALARSASLGARRRDPYSYASDDVESGLGNMDIEEPRWYAKGGGGQQPQSYASQGGRDIVMSPGGAKMYTSSSMQPPPLPAHTMSRPPPPRQTLSSSPSRPPYAVPPSETINNPYIPRASDPGPSVQQNQWNDYRQHENVSRIPSTNSYHSPASDQRSPFSKAAALGTSPHSPMLNPYNLSPQPSFDPTTVPVTAPSPHAQWGAYPPASPGGTRAPMPPRAHSQQLYPASQPVTPANNKLYDMGPPRGFPTRDGVSRTRSSPSRTGFRDVHGWDDLRPTVNTHPGGRRADPNKPGKYLSPLKTLTHALPQTYTLCNPQFRYETSDNPRRVLTKPSKPVHNDGADNEDWDYILYVNDVLGGENGGDRYLILDVLGQGTFGQVVKCQNMRTHDICAVKVVKNKPAYLHQSKMEVAILELLNNSYDPNDSRHILRMLESFTHKSHLCLVFECLSSNLYELIKQNQFKGLSTQLVKVFTQQLLDCLAVLKDARLIHCDLKPENILLKSLQSPQIKVIDFGSACHEMQTVYTYIQSRFYRSPEVLLGLPYSTAIDMWSLGCIVVELFLGLPLFPGTSEYNQLSRIVDMLGLPPTHLLEVGKQTHEFFNLVGIDAHGRKQYQLKPMDQYATEHRTQEQPSKQYFKQTKLRDVIMEYPFSKKNPKQGDIDKEMSNRKAFIDFVEGLLQLDPIKRWSPQQAVKHPFITGEKFTTPFQPSAPPPKKSYPSETSPTTPTATKKYGGLVQSPSSQRGGQRVYSDAATYNQQLAHHQSYTAQVQSAQNAPRPGPFAPGYEQQAYQHPRVPSQQHPSQPRTNPWPQPMVQQPNYQQRVPSQSLSNSSSHSTLRPTGAPMVTAPTNPPPNSYYPPSRNRANTINQMDAIPPALARLTHFGVQDPSGTRNLTPVLNRDDAMREWERRQSGHAKKSSMHNTSYPQLEYLQEQAELAAMGGQAWMMPGQYGPAHGHRTNPSSGSAQYHMQPHIGASPQGPGPQNQGEYRARDYEPPQSSRAYLPAYPPAAATNVGGLGVGAAGGGFDAFDINARDTNMGMMYTPLQPAQAAFSSPSYGSHSARASFSGPFNGGMNPFAPQQQGQGQVQGQQQSQGQVPSQGQGQGHNSPRYHRRSGGYA